MTTITTEVAETAQLANLPQIAQPAQIIDPFSISDEEILTIMSSVPPKPTLEELKQMGSIPVDEFVLADTGDDRIVWYAERRLPNGRLLQARLPAQMTDQLKPYTNFSVVRQAYANTFGKRDLTLDARLLRQELGITINGEDAVSATADLVPPYDNATYARKIGAVSAIDFDLGDLLALYETTQIRSQQGLATPDSADKITAFLRSAERFYLFSPAPVDMARVKECATPVAEQLSLFLHGLGGTHKNYSEDTVLKIIKSGTVHPLFVFENDTVIATTLLFAQPCGDSYKMRSRPIFADVFVDPANTKIEPTLRLTYNVILQRQRVQGRDINAVYTHAYSPAHEQVLRGLGFTKVGDENATPLDPKIVQLAARDGYKPAEIKVMFATQLPVYEFRINK